MDHIEKRVLTSKKPSIANDELKFLSSIQNSIAMGSWEINLQEMDLKWSDMTKKIHEVSSDYKPDFEEAIHFFPEGKYRNRLLEVFDRAVNLGENYDVELQLKSAKNNIKWVRSIGYPIFENNKCIKVHGVFQDITDRTNRIADILLKEKQINSTWHHSPNGMAIIGLDAKLKSANKSLCQFLEYTENELIGLNFSHLTYHEDKEVATAQVLEMIEGTRDHFEAEKRYISKTGKLVPCLVNVTMLRDNNNVPMHFIANLTNISKIKKAEQDIKNLLDTTESQNLRLLNFAHIVSHNLRSHSGNLQMLLDLVQDEIPESTDNDYFPLINEAVNNLSETIFNLNEISNINTRVNNDIASLNLLHFAEKAISNNRAKILETNAVIVLDIDKSIEVLAIPAYLDSILLNFVTNAIKYRQPNVALLIKLKAQKTDEHVQLDIEDNGLGINLNLHKDKLFGLYKTFHKHDDARGLGLFITKNQIDAIGAKVTVTSTVNEGTTFSLFFRYE
ncbi:PAS domain S-box protein [Subsaximicrobium wynnwilliamsii]|uniref:histidine kinase n=1 Tax=Subsaximicrobium wynnwilliamsii TaxID=291179 RepID=A0A5C6ZDL9_9FLAO|nr:PAS domain-containing sensor histidine kinase [Subsaximicrobium wynnwilliamsii]TXD82061.1 PAS domain S-box protein [Subsaximicrobium wynnwilliamsii]TXD87263.1 PAS domain S-box protein [Subsaximicrobium wynnwilliamsii]TXE01521.1 PAS domain S-box protein [Subsaximicrobium wynnwilliamsii]